MKRRVLIKHLEAAGCELLREGAKHSIYRNTYSGKRTSVPRHPGLDNATAKTICKQLDIPPP